jgi:enamine deaminase RidA (YjgF/YER057c/UK114 family)
MSYASGASATSNRRASIASATRMNTSMLEAPLFRTDIVVTPQRVPTPAVMTPEFVVTDRQWHGEPVSAPFRRLNAELAARDAKLLSVMLYGGLAVRTEIERAMREALGAIDWPVTWVDASSGARTTFAGFQAFAVSDLPVERVRIGNRVVASIFEDGTARHCLLGGLGPTATTLGRAAQTQQTLGNLEWALDLADFKLSDVVRTWFYNEDIVAWYGDFNRVRSGLYAQTSFRTGSLPASTGIGARNAAGAALTVAAWAMQPLDPTACAREVASPLQCPAPAYGSSFSRAMEVVSGGCRRLFVSGTASILPDGRTAWLNDSAKQIGLTMEVVGAILRSRGMDYQDVTRATAYCKNLSFRSLFNTWCEKHELRRFPVIVMQADVCRDDLLFEIEVDAVDSNNRTS